MACSQAVSGQYAERRRSWPVNPFGCVTANTARSMAEQGEPTLKAADTIVASSVERVEAEGTRPEALTRFYRLMTSLASDARRMIVRRALKAGIITKRGCHTFRAPTVATLQSRPALDTSTDTVARTRQQLVEEGFEAVLVRKHSPASARPRIFDGASEAKLIALACSQPPKGRKRWTLQLLEDTVRRDDPLLLQVRLESVFLAYARSYCRWRARCQCGVRSQHGGCAGGLSSAARIQSIP
jgi:hypothetical protein